MKAPFKMLGKFQKVTPCVDVLVLPPPLSAKTSNKFDDHLKVSTTSQKIGGKKPKATNKASPQKPPISNELLYL